ncbi:hypothetical protein B0H19DRAFT_1271048 [Mycena capillaripes]|nr:hypothetical protein B0H19DRAFT_1271048 [Mycena capillaripes]
MVGSYWTTPAQREFLYTNVPAYLEAKASAKETSLTRYWSTLEAAWFLKWPAEQTLGLPVRVPGDPPLLPEDLVRVGTETKKTKAQLKTWMRWREPGGGGEASGGRGGRTRGRGGRGSGHASGRSLFQLLKREKKKRLYRPVEVYQKNYASRIMAEAMRNGYGLLNEEAEQDRAAGVSTAGEGKVLTDEELQAEEQRLDDLAVERVQKNRSLRMTVWRQAADDAYGAESNEVKQEILQKMEVLNRERAESKTRIDDEERTPEEYQHAIDQISTVLGSVGEAIMKETGWHLFCMLGGPMPRRAGQISTKTICFGSTPGGNDFQSACPNFETFKIEHNKWTKRCFPHEIRDARGLAAPETTDEPPQLDDLISLDPVRSDDEKDAGIPAVAPKRIRRKRPVTQPTPAPIPSVSQPVSQTTAPVSDPKPRDDPPTTFLTHAPESFVPPGFDSVIENLDLEYDYGMATDASGYGHSGISDASTSRDNLDFQDGWSNGDTGDFDDEEDDPAFVAYAESHGVYSRPVPRAIYHGAAFDVDRESQTKSSSLPGQWIQFPSDHLPSAELAVPGIQIPGDGTLNAHS